MEKNAKKESKEAETHQRAAAKKEMAEQRAAVKQQEKIEEKRIAKKSKQQSREEMIDLKPKDTLVDEQVYLYFYSLVRELLTNRVYLNLLGNRKPKNKRRTYAFDCS